MINRDSLNTSRGLIRTLLTDLVWPTWIPPGLLGTHCTPPAHCHYVQSDARHAAASRHRPEEAGGQLIKPSSAAIEPWNSCSRVPDPGSLAVRINVTRRRMREMDPAVEPSGSQAWDSPRGEWMRVVIWDPPIQPLELSHEHRCRLYLPPPLRLDQHLRSSPGFPWPWVPVSLIPDRGAPQAAREVDGGRGRVRAPINALFCDENKVEEQRGAGPGTRDQGSGTRAGPGIRVCLCCEPAPAAPAAGRKLSLLLQNALRATRARTTRCQSRKLDLCRHLVEERWNYRVPVWWWHRKTLYQKYFYIRVNISKILTNKKNVESRQRMNNSNFM